MQHLKDATEAFKEKFHLSTSGHFFYSEASPRIYIEPIANGDGGFIVWHENHPSSKAYATTIWETPRVLREILEAKLTTLQNDIARLDK